MIAAVAAAAYVVIAVLGALASYLDNYYSESVGQYVAYDLRLRTFHHLQRLVSRFKKAVKEATHQVRREQSEIVAVVQQALESMQAVKAFGRQDLEQ